MALINNEAFRFLGVKEKESKQAENKQELVLPSWLLASIFSPL